nr:Hsp20/alpha crystallin family protein [Rikenellaceae bacterium]
MVPVTKNQTWLPSLFGDFFGEDWMPLHRKQHAAPAVNIIEHEKEYRIEVAAPGMCKEDFSVRIEHENQLVIALEKSSCKTKDNGEKESSEKSEAAQKEPTYLRRDFTYQSFRQSFILPEEVDNTKIDAKMHHGVLTICLPKKAPSEKTPVSRRIEIK